MYNYVIVKSNKILYIEVIRIYKYIIKERNKEKRE